MHCRHFVPAAAALLVALAAAAPAAGQGHSPGPPEVVGTARHDVSPPLRDITPEATTAVCQKLMPGFGELMRAVSLTKVPTAILSRQTAGIRGQSLIINLPGQPKAIAECLDAVMPAIPYCIDLIGGPFLTTDESKVKAFRPKAK